MRTDLSNLARLASVLKRGKKLVGSDVYGNLYYEDRKRCVFMSYQDLF